MKKVILTAAIVLGSLTTFTAQAQEKVQDSTATEQTATDQATTTTDQAAPAADAYTEIKVEEVPAAVTEALKKAYPDAVLSKAHMNEKKEYKLDVTVGDKVGSLYADASGNWIQK